MEFSRVLVSEVQELNTDEEDKLTWNRRQRVHTIRAYTICRFESVAAKMATIVKINFLINSQGSNL